MLKTSCNLQSITHTPTVSIWKDPPSTSKSRKSGSKIWPSQNGTITNFMSKPHSKTIAKSSTRSQIMSNYHSHRNKCCSRINNTHLNYNRESKDSMDLQTICCIWAYFKMGSRWGILRLIYRISLMGSIWKIRCGIR